MHPWLGLILFVAFMGLFVRFFVQNLPQHTDWVWIRRIRDVMAAREDYLPEVGKYNAGQAPPPQMAVQRVDKGDIERDVKPSAH